MWVELTACVKHVFLERNHLQGGESYGLNDALPLRLVEIAHRYDLPPHVIVLWVQQARPHMLSDPVYFDRHCQRYLRSAREPRVRPFRRTGDLSASRECLISRSRKS